MEIIKLTDTASTNDYLLSLNTDRDICVVADYQSAGKGMDTNTWESEPGKNLLFSILVHPTWLPVRLQYLLSMIQAVSIVHALRNGTFLYDESDNIKIKWPNDIYYGDKKLSGTRIDINLQGSKLRDVIIGTGINVNQEVFVSDAPNPISMKNITGREYDRDFLLHDILRYFERYYTALWRDIKHPSLDGMRNTISHLYHKDLYRRRGQHTFADENGTFQAEIVSVADNGIITLRRTDGTLSHYEFKEIKFC